MICLPAAKFLYRPQSVAAWSPLSLPLYGWYKSDAGISVSTDGDPIATWGDQSGNARDLTQSTAAKRPTFRTSANGVNGKPVVEFAAATTDVQQLINTTFNGNASTGFSFYVVYQATAKTIAYSGRFGIGSPSQALGSTYIRAYWPPGNLFDAVRITISGTSDYEYGAYGTQYQVGKISRSTTMAGTKLKTTYTQEQLTSVPNNGPPLGFFLGGVNGASAGTRIAEVIVCNKELTTTEEANLDTYFRSRYGFGLYYGADLPVTGAALWLDASRGDSLFAESTLATSVTTDNGAVGGWKDLSGNSLNALQATSTNRPTWRTPINGQNGLGVMSFNGSTQWLNVANMPSLASGYTFYAVLKQPTATGAVISSASAGVDGSTAAMIAGPEVTAVGNAQISTTQSKYGGASAYFNGSTGFLSATCPDITGSWTMELWWYPTSVTVQQTLIACHSGGSAGINIWCNSASRLVIDNGTVGQTAFTGGSFTANQWNHVAVVRNGTTTTGYINGTAVGSNSFSPISSTTLAVGRWLSPSPFAYLSGYIDDLRITKYARYTSNFTPPAALPDTPATDPYFAQTSLLLHMDGANGSTVFTDSSNNFGTGITQGGRSLAQPVVAGTVVGVIGNYDGTHTAGNYFARTSSSAANVSGVMTQTASTPATGTASIGRLTNATAYFNSQIYELVVLPRQSNSTEDAAWKTYTAAKWGITWS